MRPRKACLLVLLLALAQLLAVASARGPDEGERRSDGAGRACRLEGAARHQGWVRRGSGGFRAERLQSGRRRRHAGALGAVAVASIT